MINTINIVIPIYNEEKYIYQLISEINNAILNSEYKHILIIVNDYSTDNSLLEIKKAKSDFPHLKIVSIDNSSNKGKGYSLRQGFSQCQDGIIIIQDADLEYSPSEYHKLILPIINNRADVVYGSRFQGSEPKRVLYYTHFIANKLLTTLSNIFTGLNLSDMETCYKAFRCELLGHINLKENRFGFEPEITAKLSRIKDVRFVEVGISYFGRTYNEGKKIKFKDAIRTLFCIF
ncbi:MAG: glycosyltransferase family 2 protein, partial [Bacteroidales bacterium]|nr:glycosyltransferase family 2 protein [Bacteroidales bacterium]